LNLLAGKGFAIAFHGPEAPTAAFGPVQPFVLAAIHRVFGVGFLSILVVLLVRAMAHGGTAFCAYLVARRTMASRAAVLASVAVACDPLLMAFAANPGHLDCRATISLPLMMLAIWSCAIARERPRLSSALVAGVMIGLASLSEAQFVLFTLPAAAVIAGATETARGRTSTVAIIILGVLLATAPWVLRNAIVFHRFVPMRSATGLVLWAGNNPKATGLWEDQEIMRDPERRPERTGAILVGGHASTFNFFARHTLPPDVQEALGHVNEVERDRMLFKIALANIREDPHRFLVLTAQRVLYLIAAPPSPFGERFEARLNRLIGAVAHHLTPSSRGLDERLVGLPRYALSICLAAAFVLAMASALWVRTPVSLMLAAVLGIWLMVFGITHCGYPGYRVMLEPFVIIAIAAGLAKALPRLVAPGSPA
jgi:4-amino-4-deoxy-L-arabinose transferase-like glycosyltransferase